MKVLIVKGFEGLSLRSAEVRAEKLLGIDHSVIHFWEKKLALYTEEMVNNFKRASRSRGKLHKKGKG